MDERICRRDAWRLSASALVVLLAALCGTPAAAQRPLFGAEAPEPSAPEQATPRPEEKIAEVEKRIRMAQKAIDSAVAASPDDTAPPEKLTRQLQLLKQIEVLAAQQKAAEARNAELETRLAELEGRLESLRTSGPKEEPPYTFALLEQLRDELKTEQGRSDTVKSVVASAAEVVERARKQLDDAERKRRLAKEALAANKVEAKQAELATAAEEASLESTAAKESLELAQLAQQSEKLGQQLHELRLTFLTEKVAIVGPKAVLTARDLQEELGELDRKEDSLRRQRDEVQSDISFRESQWFDARKRLDEAGSDDAALVEEVEAHRLEIRAGQQRITSINNRLALLASRRTAWNRRYKFLTRAFDPQELADWRKETKATIESLERQELAQRRRLDELRRDEAALDARLQATTKLPDDVARWVRQQRDELESLGTMLERELAGIEASGMLNERLLGEIEGNGGAKKHIARAWNWVVDAWNYEITSVDDRPITIRKIVIGLFLLVTGFIASRMLSHLLARRLLSRFGIHASGVSALQSVAFYFLLIIFTLFALHVASVPLTAFTILGGALALGVGFGSQNIVNNFISGLILLAERPVRVGDLLELDGMTATVEKIGARSTRVRTGANLEIIVPNSKFLENNVINWTLSDDRIRSSVKVGVIYGSPTARVAQLLRRAADENNLALTQPEPFVLFTGFGDNSLDFELFFWLRASSLMHRMRLESELRFEIDSLFREAGLVIAFPQRDVHLDTSGPLQVQMLPPDQTSTNAEAAA
jgi:small-conductance mechanosensitive channel